MQKVLIWFLDPQKNIHLVLYPFDERGSERTGTMKPEF
jgi:hypothetical protein